MALSLENLRALVVDDSDFSAQLIKSLLGAIGVEAVITCRSVDDGLTVFRSRPDRTDVAIIDWVMPDKGGIEMLRTIRAADSPNRKLPVIMISGEPLKERVEEARRAGAHDFLVKPLSARRLENAIRHAVSDPRPFIISESYVGPDRRWHTDDPPGGDRRVRNCLDEVNEDPLSAGAPAGRSQALG
ncbi:MAG: response regulator [Rhodothalassiaceae bacterium]